jgi:hypothetical protein
MESRKELYGLISRIPWEYGISLGANTLTQIILLIISRKNEGIIIIVITCDSKVFSYYSFCFLFQFTYFLILSFISYLYKNQIISSIIILIFSNHTCIYNIIYLLTSLISMDQYSLYYDDILVNLQDYQVLGAVVGDLLKIWGIIYDQLLHSTGRGNKILRWILSNALLVCMQ